PGADRYRPVVTPAAPTETGRRVARTCTDRDGQARRPHLHRPTDHTAPPSGRQEGCGPVTARLRDAVPNTVSGPAWLTTGHTCPGLRGAARGGECLLAGPPGTRRERARAPCRPHSADEGGGRWTTHSAARAGRRWGRRPPLACSASLAGA